MDEMSRLEARKSRLIETFSSEFTWFGFRIIFKKYFQNHITPLTRASHLLVSNILWLPPLWRENLILSFQIILSSSPLTRTSHSLVSNFLFITNPLTRRSHLLVWNNRMSQPLTRTFSFSRFNFFSLPPPSREDLISSFEIVMCLPPDENISFSRFTH